MAMTKEILISNALCQMGHAPIQTLDNADSLTIAAEQAYDLLLPAVLKTGNWRFAIQIAQLSKSVETPPTGSNWTSIYLLPANFLKNIRIYPQNYQYDIYENRKLYTNWSGDAWMEYIFQPDPSKFDPQFSLYFTYEISAYLCLSNAQKPEYYAALEKRRTDAFAMASATIVQDRPNFSQVDFPVLDRRFVGGIINVNG